MNTALANFMKKNPGFVLPQIGLDFTESVGSDVYAWRITDVDANSKGFTAVQYAPKNKAVWPDQNWSFEDENGKPLLSNISMHCKFVYGHWIIDQHSLYIGAIREKLNPIFGVRYKYKDPMF